MALVFFLRVDSCTAHPTEADSLLNQSCAPSFSAKDSTLSVWDCARYTLAILCYKLRQRERHFTHTQIKIPFPQCLTRTIFSYIRHSFVALFFVFLSFYFILNLSNLLKYTNLLNIIFYLCYGGKTSVFSKKNKDVPQL